MFRTTLYKIKKSWTHNLQSRYLRFCSKNSRLTPAGTQKLSASRLKNRQKENKTSDSVDRCAICEKCRQLIKIAFGTYQDKYYGMNKHEIYKKSSLEHNEGNFDMETQEERCYRILAQIFPTEVSIKEERRIIGEEYLYATTNNEEEKLKQKIEYIDETPLVEADKSKLVEINTPPKVLDKSMLECKEEEFSFKTTIDYDLDKLALRCSGTRRDNIDKNILAEMEKVGIINMAEKRPPNQGLGLTPETDIINLDNLAKRCLDAPGREIDKRLLKEIEKLGVPQTSQRGVAEQLKIKTNIIHNEVKKQRKPIEETEIDLETREFEYEPDVRHSTFTPKPEIKELQMEGDTDCDKEKEARHIDLLKEDNEMVVKMETEAMDDTQNNIKVKEENNNKQVNQKELLYEQPFSTKKYEEPKEVAIITSVSDIKSTFNYEEALIDPYDKKCITLDTEDYGYGPLDFKNNFSVCAEEIKTINKVEDANDPLLYPSCTPLLLSKPLNEEIEDSSSTDESLTTKDSKMGPPHIPLTALSPLLTDFPDELAPRPLLTKPNLEEVSVAAPNVAENLSEKAALNPGVINLESGSTCETAPSIDLKQPVALSKLLERVRKRSRQQFCENIETEQKSLQMTSEPEVGKCGPQQPDPPTPCPPPEACPPPPRPVCPPPCPPKIPPPACPPPKPVCPPPKPVCPPQDPCQKCSKVKDFMGPKIFIIPILASTTERNDPLSDTGESHEDTVEVYSRKRIFKMLVKSKGIECCGAIDDVVNWAKDYEPWTPIPSWPIPKKEKKGQFVCPKDGCKHLNPPPKLNPPCTPSEKPCTNFPKRIFSLLDYFHVPLEAKTLYFLGKF